MFKRITHIITILCIGLVSVKQAESQVSVVFSPLAAKQFFIDDIWKTNLINSGTSAVNAVLQVQLKTGGGQNVLSVTTQTVLLQPGLNHLNAGTSGGAKWVYGNSEQSTILQSTGKLPFGQYTFCVTVFASGGKTVGDNCEEIEIEPMLPPQLLSPTNEEIVNTKYPLLTWIPPHPVISGISVTYSLRLVALQPNQVPSEGLLQNPTLINEQNLTSTSLLYPVTAQELEQGVTYAWQVAASYQGYSLGTTDIWTFTVKPPPPPPGDNIIYPVAVKTSDGHFYVTKGIFRFAYDNKANDKKLSYVIKRMDKKENLKNIPDLEIKPGFNKLEIDARKNDGMKEKEYYQLLITDSKGQQYKLLFYYITE